MKNCSTCFYHEIDNAEICGACMGQASSTDSFPKWVSIDFLSHIGDSIKWTADALMKDKASEGVKHDQDKPRWELLPFRAMQEVVEVLTYGSRKYADDNWKIVPSARSRYISAAFRHFTASINGEKNDKETGKSHLAHAVCCLLFLLWFEQEDKCSPTKK